MREPSLTLGIEEEFVLVETDGTCTAARAQAVIDRAAERLDDRVQHEFFQTQIETNTDVRSTAAGLWGDLLEARNVLTEAAGRHRCRLVASGTGVVSPRPLPVTAVPRYARMTRRYAPMVSTLRSETNGCHIHIGSLGRAEAVELGSRIRPWLPLLQALAANSPFAAGKDRRCASWRHFEAQAWPTMGPAPALDGESGYERLARGLTESGYLMDRKMIYWYVRPSEHYPTLEIRVADVNPDVAVPVLLAVLARGLAATLRAGLHEGVAAPRGDTEQLRQAHKAVAREGTAASVVDPVGGGLGSVRACLESLLDFSRSGLEASGDTETAGRLVEEVWGRGTGAEAQRADFRRRESLIDVVDGLAARTAGGGAFG